MVRPHPQERPEKLPGVTERIRTGHGNIYVTINFDKEGRPFELFTKLGKAGGCDSAQLEAISLLVSLSLRCGVDPQEVVDMLRGITCCPAWDKGTLVRSSPDAIALALERHPKADVEEPPQPAEGTQMELAGQTRRCPDCNTTLILREDCLMCIACGWNKCE